MYDAELKILYDSEHRLTDIPIFYTCKWLLGAMHYAFISPQVIMRNTYQSRLLIH